MDQKFELKLDKNELMWKLLEREVGSSIPVYLKILLIHEAFTSFAVLAAMPEDIKEKLEITAKEDFVEFDLMQQQELLKKCRNNDIMSFKLRQGDAIYLSLIRSTVIERGVHQLNEYLVAEEKKRKRSLPKDNPPTDEKTAEISNFPPEKRQCVTQDRNIDLDESRQKLVRITNGWIINSFNCEGKEAFFITEEDIKLNITETSIGTTIRCRICFHDIKILTDAYEGRPIKFVISNFSRHCKTHGVRCKPAYPPNLQYKPKPIEHYQVQEEYHIKEESLGGENDST